MKVSVIISTYNGAHKISNLLDNLVKQTIKDFEVIVMIDGSTDNTLSVVESYINRFAAIRTIWQENSGRSKVRNQGAKEAVGELLIFFDDDMVPSPNSVEEHISVHNKYKGILLAGNPQEDVELQKTDIQNYKATIAGQWMNKYTERFTFLDEKNLFFTAANCSMPKEIFERLGGFDERLTDAEDFNLGWRALNKGIKVLFDKENKATHREFITAKSYVLRLRQYSKSHKRLTELYPETKSVQIPTSPVKHFVYWFFAFAILIKWIDRSVFKILPLPIRYKFYSMVFHALSVEYPNTRI